MHHPLSDLAQLSQELRIPRIAVFQPWTSVLLISIIVFLLPYNAAFSSFTRSAVPGVIAIAAKV
jgi:hypothetical protein